MLFHNVGITFSLRRHGKRIYYNKGQICQSESKNPPMKFCFKGKRLTKCNNTDNSCGNCQKE